MLLESSKHNRMSNIRTVHIKRYNSNDESSITSINNNNPNNNNNNNVNSNEEKKDNTLLSVHHTNSKTDCLSFANLA